MIEKQMKKVKDKKSGNDELDIDESSGESGKNETEKNESESIKEKSNDESVSGKKSGGPGKKNSGVSSPKKNVEDNEEKTPIWKNPLVWIVGAVVFLVVVGGGVFYFLIGRDNFEKKNE